MARALITLERQPNGGWRRTVAWLGTARRIDARALPGDAARDAWVASVLAQATRPLNPATGERGTWEDWIEWASTALANGHDTWAIEVKPRVTLDALYEAEVLNATPPQPTTPDVRPEQVVPEDLSGYKKVRPAR